MLRRVLLIAMFVVGGRAEARWLNKAESGSVVDTFDAEVDVKKSGASTLTLAYAVRVQSEDAKTSAGRFVIDYNSATDKVDVLEAYTENDGVKVPVDPAAIEDRDQGEAKDYDAIKLRSIVFPQVQIGSRLFVKYRATTDKPLIKDHWSDHFSVWPTGAVEKMSYRVKSEVPLFFEVRDPEKYLSVKQKDAYHVEARLKRFVPGGVQAEKDPYWHPARLSEVFISTDREWTSYFGAFAGEYQRILSSDLPKTLARWVASARKLKTSEERVYFLMKQMSENLRYFGDWRRHDGGVIPRGLAEIEKSRYGDCKDLASLLAAMLRRLDLDADVALIRRGENPWGHEPDYVLPTVAAFNHAIARVKVSDRETWWLDATNPVASIQPLSDVSGRPALVLGRDGPKLDRLPDPKASDFHQDVDVSYDFTPDGGARVTTKAKFSALGGSRLAQSLMLSPRAQVLSDVLEYFSEGHEISRHSFKREPKTGRRLELIEIELSHDTEKITYTAGRNAFFVVPDAFLNGPFFETVDRESDLKLNEMPFEAHSRRRLRRARLAQDAVPPCRVESRWFAVSRVVAVEPPDVVIRQDVRLDQAYLTRDELRSPEFKAAQKAARACFSHAGVLIGLGKAALSSR